MATTAMTRDEIEKLFEDQLRAAALSKIVKRDVEDIVQRRYVELAAERDAQDTLRIRTATEAELKRWATIFGFVNVAAIVAGIIAITIYIAKELPTEASVGNTVVTYIKNNLQAEPKLHIEQLIQKAQLDHIKNASFLEERIRQLEQQINQKNSVLNKITEDSVRIEKNHQDNTKHLENAFKNIELTWPSHI